MNNGLRVKRSVTLREKSSVSEIENTYKVRIASSYT